MAYDETGTAQLLPGWKGMASTGSSSSDTCPICGHPALRQLDPATQFLYAPHTVSFLAIGLALLAYTSHAFSPVASSQPSGAANAATAGIWAAMLVFLGYSVVQGPRTSMVRPHPAVWRLVHGVLVLYTLFLVWLLYQDVDAARAFLKHLSPTLGTEVAYRTYATDCRLWIPGQGLNTGVLRDTLMDEFVLAHTLGWWGKALVLRNQLLLWVASITFELLEQTFKHMLPNFNECWWDSWILDVAICNLLGKYLNQWAVVQVLLCAHSGIWLGMQTVKYFECKHEEYDWQGLSQLPSLTQKAKRSLQQLLPYSWTRFEWMVFSSPRRCLEAGLVVALILLFDLNVFFLKYALWIPPRNPLNTYRLLLWFLCALPAVREYYEYIQGNTPVEGSCRFHKLGAFAWLAIAMSCLETLLSLKFGRGLYPAPWPRSVLWSWGAAAGTAAAALSIWQWRIYTKDRTRRGDSIPGAACSVGAKPGAKVL